MISFVGNWIQGIIVATIISTIIEMILPKGNIKKYVSVMIGLYILTSIISPIITTFYKKSINEMIDTDTFAKQIEKSETKMAQTVANNSNKTIKDIYKNNLELDIKNNLKSQGYIVKRLYIKLDNDENFTIKNIEVAVDIDKNKENNNGNSIDKIQIDDVIITNKTKNERIISEYDKEKILDYLVQSYKVDRQIIKVE